MRSSLEPSSPPPHRARSGDEQNMPPVSADAGFMAMLGGNLRRARSARPVFLAPRAADAGAGAGAGLPSRRTMSLVPRTGYVGPPPGVGTLAPTTSGPNGATLSPQKSARVRAVPVSTTVVQDGVKWVNLVRFVNLARLFTPCLRTRTRKRVRFGATPSQRARLMTSGGGAENPQGNVDVASLNAAGAAGQAGKTRPIYIQVRQGRQLVWPTFEGVDHSCFCLLLVGDQPQGSTQAVPVSSNSNVNTVQWNEVFSFPRSCLEGAVGGCVRLQVWSTESFGDDVLVGQAELALGPMLAADQPHPLHTVLDLQALDEDTGQVEPGSCGELVVSAWMEPESRAAAQRPASRRNTGTPAELNEAGVITSNMSAPCGSKSMPQVVHSPLGTLYEEPCVVALKLTVVGLVDLNYELLLASAQQGGIVKKRVKLAEGALRCSSPVKAGRREAAAGNVGAGNQPATSGGVPFASRSLSRGMRAYVDRMDRMPQQQQRALMRQLQSAHPPALEGRRQSSITGVVNRVRSATSRLVRKAEAGVSSGGAAAMAAMGATGNPGGAADELLEEDDPPTSTAGGGEDARTGTDDNDDGSSLAINPTAPLSGMASSEDPTAAGAGQGQGVFCYFKVSVDKQSAKSRLRWLPTPASTLLAMSSTPEAVKVALQPSIFVFALSRPLENVPVALSLYATGSARRRGRVVGRLVVQLYDLLDHVLGSAAAGRGGAGRRDMGVSGKPVEVMLPFDDEELGAVRTTVQLADLDERAMTFRTPLVSDPDQLMSEGVGPLLHGMGGPSCYFGPTVVPAEGFLSADGSINDNAAAGQGAAGPVLGSTKLLRQVLERSGVDADVEQLFMRSYARVGTLKAAGLVGPLQVQAPRQARQALDRPDLGTLLHPDLAALFEPAAVNASPESLAGEPPPATAAGVVRDPLGPPAQPPSNGPTAAGGVKAGGSAPTSETAARQPVAPPPALGSLVLRISSVNSSGGLGGSSSCCIVKCGPHWIRTVDRAPSENAASAPQWQVIIPLYSPATILTVGIFTNSVKSVMGLTFSDNLVLVSRVRLKLSSVRPYRRSWHVIAMYMNGGNGGGSGSPPPLVAVLGLKLQFFSWGSLVASYLAAPAPESLYELDLDGDTMLKLESDARKISENWLASAQPPIPPEVAKLLLDDGRTTFNFPRIKTNWRRVKAGMQLLFQLNTWFKHICSWKSRRDSWEVVFCIALLCYHPSTACKLFFIMTALQGTKSYICFRRKIASFAENGVDAAAALLMSPETAAAAARSTAATAPCGREPVGTVGDMTIGGGLADAGSDDEAGEDSKVPVGTVAEFKRKFAELIELGLLLQNLFDDVASILERLQAVMSFQDVTASMLFILACVLLVPVVALLGFPTTMFLLLLWQVRPPSLRDALPPPPFSYFMKLPCKSAAEFG